MEIGTTSRKEAQEAQGNEDDVSFIASVPPLRGKTGIAFR
jgi:hypothetical protein